MKKVFLLLFTLTLVFAAVFSFVIFADDDEEPQSGGNLDRLILEKTTFEYGEPVTVTAIGSGKDWVGIYFPEDPYSIRWAYIDPSQEDSVGSGVPFDITTAGVSGSNACEVFNIGDYVVELKNGANDATLAWVNIKIVPPADAPIPEKPVEAKYELKDPTSGLAAGKLTVKLKENEIAENIIPYWGDENGKLEGYTPLAKFKATSTEVTFDFPEKLMIPEGATKLLVYTSNFFNQPSEEYYEIDLPAGSSYKVTGDLIAEFQVVSDIHIVTQANHSYNDHYISMLKDITANSKNSMGIFVVGDMVDNGSESEYKKLNTLKNSVEGAPPHYFALGNHDLFGGDFGVKTKLFLKYTKMPNGDSPKSAHYDFWLNGYHFIFLGNDNLVNMIDATLNAETIEWLDKTLAEDRDKGRPTFLFLHQPMFNTVAGSLPGDGWHGLVPASESRLRMVLRKYPEVIFFNGHSHWNFESPMTMLPRGANLPTMFNTSAVAYQWTLYNSPAGERVTTSEGYYIRVYEDKVLVLGRNFLTNEWSAPTQFIVEYENGTGPKKNTVEFDVNGIGTAPEALKVAPGKTADLENVKPVSDTHTFIGWFTDKDCTAAFDGATPINDNITLYAKWEAKPVEPTPEPTTEPTDVPETTPSAPETTPAPVENDNSAIIITIAVIAIIGVVAVACFLVIKKKK